SEMKNSWRWDLFKRYFGSLVILATLVGLIFIGSAAFQPSAVTANNQAITLNVNGAEVGVAAHAVSGPVRDMPTHFGPLGEAKNERAPRPLPLKPATTIDDPVLQSVPGPLVATTAGINFAGVGNGDYGFAPNAAPPDTNGSAGATQYVQWV